MLVQKKEFLFTVIEIVIIALNIGVILFYPLSGRAKPLWYDRTAVFTVPASLTVGVFAINGGKISKAISNALFVRMGYYSRYAFLIHQVVILYCATVFSFLHLDSNIFIHISALVAYVCTLVASVIWDKRKDFFKKRTRVNLQNP